MEPIGKYLVIYDGSCGFCVNCMSLLQKLDWLNKLSYTDFRKPSFAKRNREKLKSLESEMWLVSPGKKVYKGFFAFRKITTLLPLFWLFAPFLHLPFAAAFGKKIYSFVSKRRFYISHLFHFGCKSCKNK